MNSTSNPPTEEHTLRPDFHLIAVPHNTEHWNLPELLPKIARIETVYLFDKNVHVHCCEITPSYELWPVATRAILKPEFADDDVLREEVDAVMQENQYRDVNYRHVRAVDPLLVEGVFVTLGDFNGSFKPEPYEDTSYEKHRDNTIEYCQANHQL